jgi:hypothetical protein
VHTGSARHPRGLDEVEAPPEQLVRLTGPLTVRYRAAPVRLEMTDVVNHGANPTVERIYADTVRRNPAQGEFHQAVREVLDSLGELLVSDTEGAEHKLIERICEPERQVIFRVPWQDDDGEIHINRGFGWSSARRSARTRADCGSTRRSTSGS